MTTVISPALIFITKADGQSEIFNVDKLEKSLKRSGASNETTTKIIEHLMLEAKDGMSTSQIFKHAFFLLKKIESPASIRYSLKRAVMDLGPSGFPFEKFIAEIFREKGFSVQTGVIVAGACVEHEMDVVAWNENKLLMVEAKFHNSRGTKSDLKVALYVKARFDDLQKCEFDYGRKRNLDEGWLITNTKFSTNALKYGQCENMRLVGWNYPSTGNLQDMIEDTGVHPLTCLTSITESEKHQLLNTGVVLCRHLQNTELLSRVGITSERIHQILEEINEL